MAMVDRGEGHADMTYEENRLRVSPEREKKVRAQPSSSNSPTPSKDESHHRRPSDISAITLPQIINGRVSPNSRTPTLTAIKQGEQSKKKRFSMMPLDQLDKYGTINEEMMESKEESRARAKKERGRKQSKYWEADSLEDQIVEEDPSE